MAEGARFTARIPTSMIDQRMTLIAVATKRPSFLVLIVATASEAGWRWSGGSWIVELLAMSGGVVVVG